MDDRRGTAAWMLGSLVAALLSGAAPSYSQDVSPDILKSQLGEWLIVTDDGKPGCRIKLEARRTIGGMVAVPAADCASRLPKVGAVTSWRFAQPGISLNDATRKRILLFTEDETTLLKTRDETRPVHFMVQAKPGIDRAPHAPALFGRWAMQRPNGSPLCHVTFGDKPPPGGEESFALTVDPTCDPAIKRLKLENWRIEDVSLMLYGNGGESSLRFDPAPGGAFSKAESEKGRPLLLVKVR